MDFYTNTTYMEYCFFFQRPPAGVGVLHSLLPGKKYTNTVALLLFSLKPPIAVQPNKEP